MGYADSYTEIGPRALTIWRRSEFEEFAQDSWKVNEKLHIDCGVRMSTIFGFHPLSGNADYFDGALYNPADAPKLNSAGNVILGTGNPYNGVVIPGFSSFPSSAIGRVDAATQPLCGGQSCNSLFDPSLSKSYIKTFNLIQPRLGIAYQLDAKTVIRAGIGEFTTPMPLLDNIFPGGNSPFQPFVTVNNVSVDNPGAALVNGIEPTITMTTLNPNLKQPTAWNWNVTFQRQLPLNSYLSVAYVAHRGYHAWDVYDINQSQAGSLQARCKHQFIAPLFGVRGYPGRGERSQFHVQRAAGNLEPRLCAVTETTNFEFRAEAYDFINHPNWSAPNFNPTSSQFGEVTGKSNLSRNLQLYLRFSF